MTTERELELLAVIALAQEALEKAREFVWRMSSSVATKNRFGEFYYPSISAIGKALTIQPDATALQQYIEPLVKALENFLPKNVFKEDDLWFVGTQEVASQANPFVAQALEAIAAFKGKQK